MNVKGKHESIQTFCPSRPGGGKKEEGILFRLGISLSLSLFEAYGEMTHDTTVLHEEINASVQQQNAISSARSDINHARLRRKKNDSTCEKKNGKERDTKISVTLKKKKCNAVAGAYNKRSSEV